MRYRRSRPRTKTYHEVGTLPAATMHCLHLHRRRGDNWNLFRLDRRCTGIDYSDEPGAGNIVGRSRRTNAARSKDRRRQRNSRISCQTVSSPCTAASHNGSCSFRQASRARVSPAIRIDLSKPDAGPRGICKNPIGQQRAPGQLLCRGRSPRRSIATWSPRRTGRSPAQHYPIGYRAMVFQRALPTRSGSSRQSYHHQDHDSEGATDV